jgi:membrane associated rhomboid family serine protease
MVGFGIYGAVLAGIPGAIGGMILGALLGWWVDRRARSV